MKTLHFKDIKESEYFAEYLNIDNSKLMFTDTCINETHNYIIKQLLFTNLNN